VAPFSLRENRMLATNQNWPRWIRASVSTHLKTYAANSPALPLVIEGLDDRPTAFINAPNKAEATIVGPHVRELSQGYFRVQVDVAVVITSELGKNAFDHADHVGKIQNALDRSIEVREYGNPSPAKVGCLRPRSGKDDAIHADSSKQTDPDKFSSSIVTARLIGYFYGS
jgi:hypothetical protein